MIWVQRGEAFFPTLLRFMTYRIWGDERDVPGDTMLAVPVAGTVSAVVLFQNYYPEFGTMEISAASDDSRWLRRSVVREIFGYVFDQCGCQAAILRCDPNDERMNKLAQGLGFKRYDIPRLRGRGKAEAIFVLGDDEYRQGRFHKGK